MINIVAADKFWACESGAVFTEHNMQISLDLHFLPKIKYPQARAYQISVISLGGKISLI